MQTPVGKTERRAISFSLPVPLLARVDARAREAGCSRGELIRAALSDHCRRMEADAARRVRLAKAETERERSGSDAGGGA